MKRQPAPKQKNSLRTFFLFCAVVGFLIIISLSIKLFTSVKGSIYDPKHNFIVGITSPNVFTLYSVNPHEKLLYTLTIITHGKEFIPGKEIGIIPDVIVSSATTHTHLREALPSLFLRSGKLTWFDITRLYLLSNNLEEKKQSVQLAELAKNDYSTDENFNDQEILNEQLSVGIVNATGEVGVGARLEKVVESLGATVVSVTTAQRSIKTSAITYTPPLSYSAKRFSTLTHFLLKPASEVGVSDIIIIVGKDALSSHLF